VSVPLSWAVTPAVGPIGATFRFSVTYTNTGGNWPMNTTVVVDESHWHIMDMADPTDTDPTDGMEFIYDVPGLTLAMGQHTFRFQSGYEDMFGIWDLWLPEGGGTYDGPTVTSD